MRKVGTILACLSAAIGSVGIVSVKMSSTLSANTALKIHLRWDQTISKIGRFDDSTVIIFAPMWLKQGLQELSKHVPSGTVFQVYDAKGNTHRKVLKGSLKLKDLVMIARNEPHNTSGKINFTLYDQVIQDKSVIYAIKDLVRQCIIVGKDRTTHCGGYGGTKAKVQVADVILIDQIALQFQKDYNSGRLVLTGPNVPHGLLDDLIFESVVGEKKAPLSRVRDDRSGRYVKQGEVYFDTVAYEKFVEQDFLLVCRAVDSMPPIDNKQVNLKFLKYGTGFFAGPYSRVLETHITRGILRGMRRFFESQRNNQIKSFEFPFYSSNQEIIDLCAIHSIKCSFTREDALKQSDPKAVTATTNCADPHAMAGNEMGYCSVDAAIAQNLRSNGNKFSPILNTKMKGIFEMSSNSNHHQH